MNKDLRALCEELTQNIKSAYESSVSLDEAERLASKFLYGQIQVAEALQVIDLDARMRKSGVKAISAAVRTNEIKQHDKKPTESQLQDVVNLDESVSAAQDALDRAETERDALENYFSVFKDAHIHFRGVSKGRFE